MPTKLDKLAQKFLEKEVPKGKRVQGHHAPEGEGWTWNLVRAEWANSKTGERRTELQQAIHQELPLQQAQQVAQMQQLLASIEAREKLQAAAQQQQQQQQQQQYAQGSYQQQQWVPQKQLPNFTAWRQWQEQQRKQREKEEQDRRDAIATKIIEECDTLEEMADRFHKELPGTQWCKLLWETHDESTIEPDGTPKRQRIVPTDKWCLACGGTREPVVTEHEMNEGEDDGTPF